MVQRLEVAECSLVIMCVCRPTFGRMHFASIVTRLTIIRRAIVTTATIGTAPPSQAGSVRRSVTTGTGCPSRYNGHWKTSSCRVGRCEPFRKIGTTNTPFETTIADLREEIRWSARNGFGHGWLSARTAYVGPRRAQRIQSAVPVDVATSTSHHDPVLHTADWPGSIGTRCTDSERGTRQR